MNFAGKKIVICGPTACGKSRLAFELAKRINGTIINFDSQQVYKEIPILSAQPSLFEQNVVEHKLYSVLSGNEPANVAIWLNMALKIIQELGDKPMIFVGGTGLYLNALLYGLSPIPEIPDDIRNMVRNLSFEEVVLQLGTGCRDYKNNHRMRRNLEVKMATGKDLEYFYSMPKQHLFSVSDFRIYSVIVPRETTYASINSRLEIMLSNGGIDEINELFHDSSINLNSPMMKACGVREILSYFKGDMSFETATMLAKQSTRNYAKRQMTWFRNKLPQHTVEIGNNSIDLIMKDLENKTYENIFKSS